MSALQVERNSFSAHLALPAGVAVSITAPTLNDLQLVVTRLQPPANDTTVASPAAAQPTAAPKPAKPETKAATPTVTASPTPVPTSAPVSAPAAASGSESTGGEAPRPTYDDVKARVLALMKVSRETCIGALAKFTGVNGQPVDHGNKLKLEDYPAFIAHADQLLASAK